MAIAIFAAALGLVIAVAAISIPQWVRARHQKSDNDDDTQAYLKSTGRSAEDIAEGDAAERAQQESEAESRQAGS